MSKSFDQYLTALKKIKIRKSLLDLIAEFPREEFLDPVLRKDAYRLEPIPIGFGQATDDPASMARMIDLLALRKTWRVLEVGTGSGYSTALIASLAKEVVTVEYIEELAMKAKGLLVDKGFHNVQYFAGDATAQLPGTDDFDAVIIFAGCRKTPLNILGRLKEGGVMAVPLGPAHQQQITLYANNLSQKDTTDNYRFLDFCSFPTIRGKYGWENAIPFEMEDMPDGRNPGSAV